MDSRGLIGLPPTRADLTIARASYRATTPAAQQVLRTVTWLADEKIVLGGAVLFWIHARLEQRDKAIAREADRILCGVALAGALPHVVKWLVRRKRPNRTIPRGDRRGVARSGQAWDSFPSGHAVHLGVIASPLVRFAPRALRPLLWSALGALAATRVVLLAHYPSDVVAGFGIGMLLNKLVGSIIRR